MDTNVVIVGAGVAGINAATKLVDNNFNGKITIIDMGLDPYRRPASDVMRGLIKLYLTLNVSTPTHLKYNVQTQKQNLILLNPILV